MNEERKKTNKGLVAAIIILIILFIGTLGYIGYDYYTDHNPQDETDKLEEQTETLVEGNAFRLKDIKCETGSSSYTKELKVAYNNENHDIKIVYSYEKSSTSAEDEDASYTLNYELYIDNNLADTLEGGTLITNDINNYTLGEFDGYIYIFDGKYLGFLREMLLPVGSAGYKLSIYNDGKKALTKDVDVDFAGQSFGESGTNLDGIDNIGFDGTTLKYWFLGCDNHNKAFKLGLTFNGEKTNITVLETKDNVEGGGASGCYNTKTNSYNFS